jgi:4-hydroxyphenylpyruvate dioxygenase
MMGVHLMQHGDGVKDVAFAVEDLDGIVERAKSKGCKIDRDIWEESDQFGKVKLSKIELNKTGFRPVSRQQQDWFRNML